MGKYRRRRVKLKAHDRGDNRHEKGVAWTYKQGRQRAYLNAHQKKS